METTRKIRLVIEAEVHQDSEISPAVMAKAGYRPKPEDSADPEWQQTLQANQALLTVLLANPRVYQEVVLRNLEADLSDNQKFMKLAGFPEAGFSAMEQLIPEVPEPARQFWLDSQAYGTFSDQAHFALYSTSTRLLSIRLEEAD